MKGIPPECRKIFKILYIEGKNYQQIAEELNSLTKPKGERSTIIEEAGVVYLVALQVL